MPIVLKSGSLNLLEPSGPAQASNGIALPLPLPLPYYITYSRRHRAGLWYISLPSQGSAFNARPCYEKVRWVHWYWHRVLSEYFGFPFFVSFQPKFHNHSPVTDRLSRQQTASLNITSLLLVNYVNMLLDRICLCYVMLCYVMLCYVMLCYVMLCYVMLCCVMLCYVTLRSIRLGKVGLGWVGSGLVELG